MRKKTFSEFRKGKEIKISEFRKSKERKERERRG